VRYLSDLPLLRGVGTRDALARARIFDITATVPFEPPDVEGVVEDTGATFSLAADCGVAPWAPVRAGYTFGIELFSDGARTVPIRKFCEYTTDDSSFDGIDLPFAGRVGDEIVPIRFAAQAGRARSSA
jgi:hypothetical protein